MATENLPVTQASTSVSRERIIVEDSQALFDSGRFEQIQRAAGALMYSSMLPIAVQGPADLPFEHRAMVTRANLVLLCDVADRWKMPLNSVVQCASIIHGRLCFEGKLIAAVIEQRLGVRLDYEWTSEDLAGARKQGDDFGITVSGSRDGDTKPKTVMGTVGGWKTLTKDKSGPLPQWQFPQNRLQLAYRGAREWCRLWAPWIMLGVYSDDELEAESDRRPNNYQQAVTPAVTFARPPATVEETTNDGITDADFTDAGNEGEKRGGPDAGGTGDGDSAGSGEGDKPDLQRRGERTPDKNPTGQPDADNRATSADLAASTAGSGSSDARGTGKSDGISEGKGTIKAGSSGEPAGKQKAAPAARGAAQETAFELGFKASVAGKGNTAPKGLTEAEAIDWSLGWNEAEALKVNAEREATDTAVAAGDVDDEVLEDDDVDEKGPDLPQTSEEQERTMELNAEEERDSLEGMAYAGFVAASEGKPKTPPRGLVHAEIEAWLRGYASVADSKLEVTDPPVQHTKISLEQAAKIANGEAASDDPWTAFDLACEASIGWGGIKKALISLAASQPYKDDLAEGGGRVKATRRRAWLRVEAITNEGRESIEPTNDVSAYRCWLEFVNQPEDIEDMWETMMASEVYKNLNDGQKGQITKATKARIAELQEPDLS